MKIYLSLGSNLGDRKKYLKKAILRLKSLSKHIALLRYSPLYETPPLLPKKPRENWNYPFLNLVLEMEYEIQKTKKSQIQKREESHSKTKKENQRKNQKKNQAQNKKMNKQNLQSEIRSDIQSFFKDIKNLEKKLGRKKQIRGAPRTIDIDLLYCEGLKISNPTLKIPHKGIKERSFFLDPLKHLTPDSSFTFNQKKKEISVLSLSRKKKSHLPLWMGIINITPDSFSDGGKINTCIDLEKHLKKLSKNDITPQILDFGAESTRPRAQTLKPKDEWKRLSPFLKFVKEKYKNKTFKPLISVDTQNAETANKALELGVDWINDVSGLKDKNMLSVLKAFPSSEYILTHSLGAPVRKEKHLPLKVDPVKVIKNWALEKTAWLEKNGIEKKRIIFDPGIGFGKTALQSMEILRRIKEFHDLPLRLLIGPSRKSFMNSFTSEVFSKRDVETLGISLWLLNQGVDILRVHNVVQHVRAFRAWSHVDLKPLHLV